MSLEEEHEVEDKEKLQYFKARFNLLVTRSLEVSPTMVKLNETNQYSFGKLKLGILSLENLACSSTFFIRITMHPYVLNSRKIIGLDSERLN